ncbi:MAG TPA: methyltransferase domain-containing protein [Draconibacterium sp.]|nr:methyltransferase domain-containing protein [Draconibacterium sp.]
MNNLQKLFKIIGTGFTKDQYYESMNMALKRLDNEYTMLHYPLYVKESDSFIQAQKNLTDYCISLLDPIKDKEIIEIGCGNGVQSLYIKANYFPLRITGIDINKANIEIANGERDRTNIQNVIFLTGDAQNLTQISSNSVDVLINIESAFHYPDKPAFLKEVHRVLKPGGQCLIADILTTRNKRNQLLKLWGKTMVYHFWNKKQYEEEFLKSELEMNYSEDITQRVIKGWSNYRKWIPKIKRKLFLQNVVYKIFYVINARINIYFLTSRQQYVIYVGSKPNVNNFGQN